MKINQQNDNFVNRNVMEILVSDEIDRQISRYPENIRKFINRIEVATYALNRLPPLYASSQQGFNKQKLKGRAQHSVQITQAVRKGFAAIQQDLLRYSTPLLADDGRDLDRDIEEAKQALQELAEYLPDREFSWQKVVKLVKPMLAELSYQQGEGNNKKIRSRASALWTDSAYQR